MILENDTPFTDGISEISNRQVDNTKDLDIAMPLYNLIKCSSSYSKKFFGNIAEVDQKIT